MYLYSSLESQGSFVVIICWKNVANVRLLSIGKRQIKLKINKCDFHKYIKCEEFGNNIFKITNWKPPYECLAPSAASLWRRSAVSRRLMNTQHPQHPPYEDRSSLLMKVQHRQQPNYEGAALTAASLRRRSTVSSRLMKAQHRQQPRDTLCCN